MSEIRVDTISEKTSSNGVAIDSLAIKDGKVTNLMNSTLNAADMGAVHIKVASSGDTAIDSNNDDLVIENDNHAGITISTPNDKAGGLYFSDPDDAASGRIVYDHSANTMIFQAGNAERVRLDGNKIGFGTSSPSAGLDIARDDTLLRGTNASSTANFQNVRLFSAVGGTGTETFRIENDGDVKNTNNSYGSLSDERIKQDITDASSQWEDIKALKIKNFKRIDQVNAGLNNKMIGVIAQDLEAAGMSGLIKESIPSTGEIRANEIFGTIEEKKIYYNENDAEVESGEKTINDVKETVLEENPSDETVKSVKYSVLYMKAVKALQEAMTRIETLEAEVTALKE